jgi:hypothetical protein
MRELGSPLWLAVTQGWTRRGAGTSASRSRLLTGPSHLPLFLSNRGHGPQPALLSPRPSPRLNQLRMRSFLQTRMGAKLERGRVDRWVQVPSRQACVWLPLLPTTCTLLLGFGATPQVEANSSCPSALCVSGRLLLRVEAGRARANA